MASPPGRRIRCGAKARSTGGQPCKRWAAPKAQRCRLHGGTHPKGADAPQAQQRLVHGLYAKCFTDAEKTRFEELFGEMMNDPTTAMMADAALMRVKAETALSRADANGMVMVRQSAVKRTEKVIDATTGEAIARQHVIETVSAERQDVTVPITDLQMKAASLAERSFLLKKKAGITVAPESALGERDLAAIIREEFADAGAYGAKKDDDGPEPGGPDDEPGAGS